MALSKLLNRSPFINQKSAGECTDLDRDCQFQMLASCPLIQFRMKNFYFYLFFTDHYYVSKNEMVELCTSRCKAIRIRLAS